jgi:NAD(P)-dependent dehydrogenase (short-subunit alcohol dehydrogenase family)
MLLGDPNASGNDVKSIVTFNTNKTLMSFIADEEAFEPLASSYTPDHIVYCKADPLFIKSVSDIEEQYNLIKAGLNQYKEKYGYNPKIVVVEKLGVFAQGSTKKNADTAMALFMDSVKVAVYTKSFGGHSFLPQHLKEFIVNWEVENYRQKIGTENNSKRIAEKITIVTGAAQGFGQGIADDMLKQGANMIIADLNYELASKNACELCEVFGKGKVIAVKTDVSNEDSVKNMVYDTVLAFGGVDIIVSNAGISRPGGLEEMTQNLFDLMVKVNYTGYYLCAKYTSRIMKIQHKFNPNYYMDIIQVNSKSGLTGSNKNFAYAGSKFAGAGLTQSFALELVEYNIKVNAVCPDNFFDGPLWSDPEKGLFKQFLDAGKAPGAKNVDDVRKFYESKIPMKKGCMPSDVARAILYCIEQLYETGQAIPITGGQTMLK